jgi:hypothetical protein
MSATTYTITTSAAGLDRHPQSVAVQPDASTTTVITLAIVGAQPTSKVLTFTSSGAAQTFNITPNLGRKGGTVTVTGTNSTSLTDPSPATVAIKANKIRRQSGRLGRARLDFPLPKP